MKILLTICLLLIINQNCNAIEDKFLTTVLSDFRRNSFFVLLKVTSNGNSRNVIIENDDLFFFLSEMKGFDEIQYKAFVKELIIEDCSLNIDATELNKWGFVEIPHIKSVSKMALKGEKKFIEKYFKETAIKNRISKNKEISIINYLFKWKIGTFKDDQTGYLVFTDFDEKTEVKK